MNLAQTGRGDCVRHEMCVKAHVTTSSVTAYKALFEALVGAGNNAPLFNASGTRLPALHYLLVNSGQYG